MFRLPAAALGLFVLAMPAAAQTSRSDIPRAPDGHVDISGHWNTRSLTTMERAAPGPLVVDAKRARELADGARAFLRSPERATVTDPSAYVADVQSLSRVGDEWRTSMITVPENGKLPLTEAGRRRISVANAASATESALGPETRDGFERCLAGPGRTPMFLVPGNNFRQIVQAGDFVLLYTEEGGDVRRVKINGDHLPGAIVSDYGDSIGRWEKDDLVVTTTNLRSYASGFPWGLIAVGENSLVVERMTLLSPDELRYRFTVEDSSLYSQPWSAEFSMVRSAPETYEYACHESNYSLVNILTAARIMER